MNPTVITSIFALVAVALFSSAVVVGYQRQQARDLPSPTPVITQLTTEVTPNQNSELSPNTTSLPTTPALTPFPTPYTRSLGTTAVPTPVVSTLWPMPQATTAAKATGPLRVQFVNTPSQVHAGQTFTVTWRIDGPAGMRGDQTTLTAIYDTSDSREGDQSSSSTSNSSHTTNSFGSFTVPQSFSTTLAYGNTPGSIELRVIATAQGQMTSARQVISLIP